MVRCVSSGQDVCRVLPRFRKQFIDRRVQAKINVRMIAVRSDKMGQTWKSSTRDLRVTKMFDGKKYPFFIEADFYCDKVLLLSTTEPIGGVIIQNRAIAHSMRSFFDIAWDLMGEPEPCAD